MSITYTPTTNFGSKDSLPSNDPNKVIKGAEFTTEFTAIQSAFGLAAPSSNPTFTGTATFDSVTADAVSLGDVTTSDLTVSGTSTLGVLNAGTTTVGAFTSVGIDDNATSTAITIDANENVGIGTDAPASALHVDGDFVSVTNGTEFGYLQNVGGAFQIGTAGSSTASDLSFATLGTQRMRITDTGNVGIGTVTPNAAGNYNNGWGLSLGLDRTFIGTSTGGDSVLGGASGSTHTAIHSDGVERLRVDNAGNVGIGEANPQHSLDVNTGATTRAKFSNGSQQILIGTWASQPRIESSGGELSFGTGDNNPIVFKTNGSEEMRITAAGLVGIGTDTPTEFLSIDGAAPAVSLGNTSGSTDWRMQNVDNSVRWVSNPRAGGASAERMRINGSGNLLVGTTTPASGYNTTLASSGNTGALAVKALATSGITYDTLQVTTGQAASATHYLTRMYSGGVPQFAVRADGKIYATDPTGIYSISDERTKENIRESTDGLDVINALRPVRFDYKEDFGNGEANKLGFIAQEVEAVFADAVSDTLEETDDGDVYKAVASGAMIPVLVKAMQEQQAMIEALKAEVEALKNA